MTQTLLLGPNTFWDPKRPKRFMMVNLWDFSRYLERLLNGGLKMIPGITPTRRCQNRRDPGRLTGWKTMNCQLQLVFMDHWSRSWLYRNCPHFWPFPVKIIIFTMGGRGENAIDNNWFMKMSGGKRPRWIGLKSPEKIITTLGDGFKIFKTVHLQFFMCAYISPLWGWVTRPPKNQKFIYKKPCLNVGVSFKTTWLAPTSQPQLFPVRPSTGLLQCSLCGWALPTNGHPGQRTDIFAILWKLGDVTKAMGIAMEYQQLHCHNHALELCSMLCVFVGLKGKWDGWF